MPTDGAISISSMVQPSRWNCRRLSADHRPAAPNCAVDRPGTATAWVMPLARATGMCVARGMDRASPRSSCGLKAPISVMSLVARPRRSRSARADSSRRRGRGRRRALAIDSSAPCGIGDRSAHRQDRPSAMITVPSSMGGPGDGDDPRALDDVRPAGWLRHEEGRHDEARQHHIRCDDVQSRDPRRGRCVWLVTRALIAGRSGAFRPPCVGRRSGVVGAVRRSDAVGCRRSGLFQLVLQRLLLLGAGLACFEVLLADRSRPRRRSGSSAGTA